MRLPWEHYSLTPWFKNTSTSAAITASLWAPSIHLIWSCIASNVETLPICYIHTYVVYLFTKITTDSNPWSAVCVLLKSGMGTTLFWTVLYTLSCRTFQLWLVHRAPRNIQKVNRSLPGYKLSPHTIENQDYWVVYNCISHEYNVTNLPRFWTIKWDETCTCTK